MLYKKKIIYKLLYLKNEKSHQKKMYFKAEQWYFCMALTKFKKKFTAGDATS